MYLHNGVYSPYENPEDDEDALYMAAREEETNWILSNGGFDLCREYKLPTGMVLGENGMPTFEDTGNELVNLFGTIGAHRNKSEKDIIKIFQASFLKYPEPSLKLLFHLRDIRGGMGERRTFRILLEWMGQHYPKIIRQYLHLVPEFGRWDDLFCFLEDVYDGTDLQRDVAFLWLSALLDGNFLAGKWCPREGKKYDSYANKLRKLWDLSPKEYRLLITEKTKVVETLMCDKKWLEIVYKGVPSQAMLKYRKAFMRHDPEGFASYLAKVKKGEVKINATTLFPHQIVDQALRYTSRIGDATLEALWEALPNYLAGSEISILPVSDVSSSMAQQGGLPMLVSVALGMYISERNEGPYKDLVYLFSNDPTPIKLKGDFYERVQQLRNARWGGSTDLEKTFEHILEVARKYKISQDLLPKYVVILSDMQFNQIEGRRDSTSLRMIDDMYKRYGYTRPNIIFWNLRASTGHPVRFDEFGTAMVSGFSPSIMESILKIDLDGINEALNPLNVCIKTLYSKRYENIRL